MGDLIVEFATRPDNACDACQQGDDIWSADLFKDRFGDTQAFLQVEGHTRAGQDPGQAFVTALQELIATQCSRR